MPLLEVERGVNLYYEDKGKGKNILFVHGFSASHDAWEYQTLYFDGKCRTVAVDLRGHGDSDKSDSSYTNDMFASDVIQVIDKLGLQQITLVGWSLGASIALRYMMNFGDRVSKLVLVGGKPAFYSKPGFPYGADLKKAKAAEDYMRTNLPDATRKMVQSWFRKELSHDAFAWLYNIVNKTPLMVRFRVLKARLKSDNLSILPKIKVPSAVFHGKYDANVPLSAGKYMAKKIPGCKLVVFEESGHSPMIEQPENFNQQLARFVGIE